MTKTKVKVSKGKHQPDCKTLHPYRMGRDKRILIDAASRQTIEQLFSLRNAGARISDLLEVAGACLPLTDGGRWNEERMNTYLGDPIHAGYHLKREGEKYVMTRLNFPDPPISLEDWLECNPLVRMRPIRLE